MSTPRNSKLTPAKLRVAFKEDLAAAWTYFCAKHPDYTPYAFVLYGVEGRPRLSPHVLAEQSLTTVAQKYLEKGHHDTLDEARSALRYSVPDSPLFSELENQLSTVDAMVEPHATTLDETSGYALLARAAMAALKELDAEGLFGTGPDRERLLVMIVTEDTEKNWSMDSARRLNPKSVFQRFEAATKIEGTFIACNALAVSPDGRTLYAFGSRAKEGEIRHPDRQFDSEIYALNLQGQQLLRRWTFLPGDSGSQRGFAPDGQSVIVLRENYAKRTRQAILMRFAPDIREPIQQGTLSGDPDCFALRADGSRLAVAMHDGTLHILDHDFRLLQSGRLDVKPRGMMFERSGHLLVAAGEQLLRVAPATFTVEESIPLASFRLVADDSERVLAVSGWFMDRKDEFGVDLLSLPSLEPIRTFLIPGHQAVTAALSPNGCLLAFEAPRD